MRILLLNQFIPPDGAPTARLLGDLRERLESEGWEVKLVGASAGYQGGAKTGASRLARDIKAHLLLLWAGLRAGPCDWVLCLTDPPGLPFTAAVLAAIKRARLAHWAMDVYPEVAVRLGALRRGAVSRTVAATMRLGYRRSEVLVALDEDMRRIIENAGGRNVRIQPPWPPLVGMDAATENPAGAGPQKPGTRRTWLYSGNLGRAHEYADLLEAQRQLESEGASWQLVFQGGGPSRDKARAEAADMELRHCLWQDYAPEEQLIDSLLAADVLVATQKESMLGLLWPSKLALMMQLQRPILWVGPADGHIAAELRAHSPAHGVFAPGQASAIAAWLRNLPPSPAEVPAGKAGICARVNTLRDSGLTRMAD